MSPQLRKHIPIEFAYNISAVAKNISAMAKNILAVAKNISAVAKNISAVAKNISAVAKNISAGRCIEQVEHTVTVLSANYTFNLFYSDCKYKIIKFIMFA